MNKEKRYKNFFKPLDKLEQDLLEDEKKGEFILEPNQEEWKAKLKAAARATLVKNRHISIRVWEADLEKLKARAAELGIPYQTLIGSILHQYVEGRMRASF